MSGLRICGVGGAAVHRGFRLSLVWPMRLDMDRLDGGRGGDGEGVLVLLLLGGLGAVGLGIRCCRGLLEKLFAGLGGHLFVGGLRCLVTLCMGERGLRLTGVGVVVVKSVVVMLGCRMLGIVAPCQSSC